jgi:hypothetical protein
MGKLGRYRVIIDLKDSESTMDSQNGSIRKENHMYNGKTR